MTIHPSKWENCVTGKAWLQNHASHDAIECKAEVLFAELLNKIFGYFIIYLLLLYLMGGFYWVN